MALGCTVAAHRLQMSLAKAVLIPRSPTQLSGDLLNEELRMLVSYLRDSRQRRGWLQQARKCNTTASTITGQRGTQVPRCPLNISVTHRGDGLPANRCNGQFRADGKSAKRPHFSRRHNAFDDLTIIWMVILRGRFEPGRVVCRVFFSGNGNYNGDDA